MSAVFVRLLEYHEMDRDRSWHRRREVEQAGRDATVEALRSALAPVSCAFSDEATLHATIEDALERAGIHFEHELSLDSANRPDFLVGGIALEAKIAGSLASVTRQLHRYAALEAVSAVVLVTTCMRHTRLPNTMCGRAVHVIHLNPLRGL